VKVARPPALPKSDAGVDGDGAPDQA